MDIFTMRTQRLELIAASSEHIKADINDKNRFSGMLNAEIPDNWPNEELGEVLTVFMEMLEFNPELRGWILWYWILDDGKRKLIGSGGFHGKFNENGEAEIGYSVLEQFRNSGYAKEGVKKLIEWAYSHPEVKTLKAEVSPDSQFSTESIRVLERNGFKLKGKTENGALDFRYDKLDF